MKIDKNRNWFFIKSFKIEKKNGGKTDQKNKKKGGTIQRREEFKGEHD